MKKTTRIQWIALIGIIGLFIGLCLGADLLPGVKFPLSSAQTKLTPFFRLSQLSLSMRYYSGGAVQSYESLSYMLVLKFVHALVPSRLGSLRAVSVLATVLSMVFLFRAGCRLFSPAVGLLWVFLLVTAPDWVDSMRTFGIVPFTHLFVAVACYCLAVLGENRRYFFAAAGLAFAMFVLLSGYLPGRLVFWFSLAYALLYPRTVGKRWLIFIVLFIGFIFVVDTAAADVSFSLKEFLFPRISGEWVVSNKQTPLTLLTGNLAHNAPYLFRYLFPLSGAFYSIIHTPAFMVGLGLCLFRRRQSDIFLLLYFCIFFLTPFTANAVPLRRMVFSFDPLYLLIALGWWQIYQFVWARIASPAARKLIAGGAGAAILLVGATAARGFLFFTSRPLFFPAQPNASNFLMELLTDPSRTRGYVLYDEAIANLIWENPDYVEQVSPSLNERLKFCRPDNVRGMAKEGLSRGYSSLLIYPDRATASYRPYLDWGKTRFPDLLEEGSLPVLNLRYSFLPAPAALSPELLSTEKPTMLVSTGLRSKKSIYIPRPDILNILTDGDPTEAWDPGPRNTGEPSWVQVDFGPETRRVVRVLGASPGGDPPQEKGFLRGAELWGATDGIAWDLIAEIRDDAPADPLGWRFWVLANERSFRYFRLVIREPGAKGEDRFRGLGDLAFYEHENAFPLLQLSDDSTVYRGGGYSRP